MKIYAATIFLSAFLLFLVQPMIGKFIAPWFGSTTSVWTTCLLFFQLLLLAGYAYAHLLSKLKAGTQATLHVVLLIGAALLLPVTPSSFWKPLNAESPSWRILVLLTATVGAPYFILSSSSPLLQRWFAVKNTGHSPYRLYALSNAGSLLALLAYPFAVEPMVRLRQQTLDWSWVFVGFALLSGLCAWGIRKAVAPKEKPQLRSHRTADSPGLEAVLLWLGLAAAGSVVLLATINQVGRDLPPVPFLFILPLALYLVTFIIAFDSPRWYSRRVHVYYILPAGIVAGSFLFVRLGTHGDIVLQLTLYSFALIACCMACHGELARHKPAAGHLTLYYLIISLGGALGGLFVAVIAPVIFNDVWEYPVGLILSFGLVMFVVARDSDAFRPAMPDQPNMPDSRAGRQGPRVGAVSKNESKQSNTQRTGRTIASVGGIGVLSLIAFFSWNATSSNTDVVEKTRNFYGVLRIISSVVPVPLAGAPGGWIQAREFNMRHGMTIHGFQFRHPLLQNWATSYYTRGSGLGLAIDRHPKRMVPDRQFRMGVIGLGVGTTAAYANEAGYMEDAKKQAGDYLRFYEINPEVARLANKYFTYLSDAAARNADVGIFPGDARLTMERQLREGKGQHFDVLAIDAFSGDAIPMHLLTSECFENYLAHLNEGGILAFHITNEMLNLAPVVAALAERYGKTAGLFSGPPDRRTAAMHSSWVLVSDNAEFWSQPEVQAVRNPLTSFGEPVLWTDDYSSLLQVLK